MTGRHLDATGFYVTGGTMLPDAPSYVERPADKELEDTVLQGEYCYVLTARQMGKSSLMARTASKLRHQGILCAIVDLTRMDSANADPMTWYAGIIDRIHRDLQLGFDLRQWLRDNDHLGPVRQFTEYVSEVASQIETPAVIFVDEIDSTIPLPFADDFFAAVRACYNARATESVFCRITFVLLGATTPPQLIRNPVRTPFNIGHQINLEDLPRGEAMDKLAVGLHTEEHKRNLLFDEIYHWTAGHPYLTQKLCAEVAASRGGKTVDAIVAELFFGETSRNTENHLKTTADRLRASGSDALQLYVQIQSGADVEDQPASPEFMALRLAGVVKSDKFGRLRVRNRIYQRVFTGEWALGILPGAARVYISSTSEDLREYRVAAREAVLAVGLRPEMMEYFGAAGGPPLDECLARVSPCDVVVAIVAERYGWVPPDQPMDEAKSITWLECEHAASRERELLVFFPADSNTWPSEKLEAFRLTEAIKKNTFTPELTVEVQRNVARLKDFRKWLETGRTRATFTTPDDLKAKITQALYQWLDRHPDFRPARPGAQNPRTYLEWLRDQTATIDIRGLGEGAGRARNFPIDELYIPLTTASYTDERPFSGAAEERKPVLLEEALAHRRLVIVGDPGSGKTTFLRRIAFEIANGVLEGARPMAASEPASESQPWGMLTRLWSHLSVGQNTTATSSQPSFPILIRIADLIDHIDKYRAEVGNRASPAPEDPSWIGRFLATRNTTFGWGLGPDYFLEKMNSGDAVVMLDGLDEAPERHKREQASRLFEHVTAKYKKCRFVVTTRPQSYVGGALLADFHEARIEPLDEKAVHTFLDRWCRGIYPESRQMAEQHRDELAGALRAVPGIRKMTRNPVMLTALAVVHWNEKRIPEQRADLYDSILTWLSREREKRAGRERAERCLTLLAELALAMQNHPRGRQVRVSAPWAADALAVHFGPAPEAERITHAARFLEEETADSGIVVSRGGELQFWHLTFQEYLAATAIAGKPDQEQIQLLFEDGKTYRPEWRETVLLLAGVLRVKQGKAKVDGVATAILDRAGSKLADQARAADLLGAIVNDLRPFDYQPPDPMRYRALMDATLGVFERASVKRVEFAVRLAAAEALGQAGDPRLSRENWIRIEGGTSGLKSFEIGKYPVTVQEYARFMEAGGYRDKQWWNAGGFGKKDQPENWDSQKEHPNWPVTDVNWYEASAYAAWAGGRLLTEAEWESAARGEQGREYPWGNEEPDATRANYSKTGPKQPTPVGLYPCGATPEGVEDMAGNVWEWTASWYDQKQRAKVLRGGSWGDFASNLRASNRGDFGPEVRYGVLGLRVAREVVP